jgi:hypothetical protein
MNPGIRAAYRDLMNTSVRTIRRDLEFHSQTGPGMRQSRPDPAAIARRLREKCLNNADVTGGEENASLRSSITEIVALLEGRPPTSGSSTSSGSVTPAR